MGQKLMCPRVVLQPPEPMKPHVIGTWAYRTVKERMRAILQNVLATVGADGEALANQIGAFGHESIESVQSELEQLLDGLCNNKYLTFMNGSMDDVALWNRELENQYDGHEPPRWHSGDWLYVECYMYRKLYDIFDSTGILTNYDYFHEPKASSYRNSEAVIEQLGITLVEEIAALCNMSQKQRRECFERFLMVCLWGNECDMSLSGGKHVAITESPLDRLDTLSKKLVIDDHHSIYSHLTSHKLTKHKIRVDLVMDNAGVELFADFCLADLIVTMGLATKVVCHVKAIPWFVSDATSYDVQWMLNQMKESQLSETLPSLAQRWQQNFKVGTWELATSPFWTTPFGYDRMSTAGKELYLSLFRSTLILFKGDLNYRKLMGNRKWPVDTSFGRALNGFHPAPLAALRILKADIIVGISQRQARRLSAQQADWMTCGQYAQVQFCRRLTPVDMV